MPDATELKQILLGSFQERIEAAFPTPEDFKLFLIERGLFEPKVGYSEFRTTSDRAEDLASGREDAPYKAIKPGFSAFLGAPAVPIPGNWNNWDDVMPQVMDEIGQRGVSFARRLDEALNLVAKKSERFVVPRAFRKGDAQISDADLAVLETVPDRRLLAYRDRTRSLKASAEDIDEDEAARPADFRIDEGHELKAKGPKLTDAQIAVLEALPPEQLDLYISARRQSRPDSFGAGRKRR